MPGQAGMIGDGQPEFIVFEPHRQDPHVYLLCVNIDETSDPIEADYTLTLVNFDL